MEIAKTLKIKLQMCLKGSIIISNHIPEKYALDYTYANSIIEKALLECIFLGIKGKDLTKENSLDTNIKLIFNNTKLATQIACE